MKTILIFLAILFGFQSLAIAQSISPDKMISYMRDKGDGLAFTVPGWLVKMAGKIADNNLDEKEQRMIKELTSHIKKIRFVTSENLPNGFKEKFGHMKNYLSKKKYEPLVEARDNGTDIQIWGKFDGDIIKNLIIAAINTEDESTLFNIKSSIDMNRLQQMEFYKELKSE